MSHSNGERYVLSGWPESWPRRRREALLRQEAYRRLTPRHSTPSPAGAVSPPRPRSSSLEIGARQSRYWLNSFQEYGKCRPAKFVTLRPSSQRNNLADVVSTHGSPRMLIAPPCCQKVDQHGDERPDPRIAEAGDHTAAQASRAQVTACYRAEL